MQVVVFVLHVFLVTGPLGSVKIRIHTTIPANLLVICYGREFGFASTVLVESPSIRKDVLGPPSLEGSLFLKHPKDVVIRSWDERRIIIIPISQGEGRNSP